MTIQIKRIYEAQNSCDGYRILVDKLWPRGIKKQNVGIDLWMKDIAPSNELRKWFNHDPQKWIEFQHRYANELMNKKELLAFITHQSNTMTVTLLFAAKDTEHNHAAALRNYLLNHKINEA